MPPEVATDWEVFKQLFQKRFIPPEYIDRKKQEFTHLRQGKMTTNEYYRRFTDLSRYDPEVAANPVEMLRRFRLSIKKKWHSIVTSTPCATYQEFYEVLLPIEDSENMPSESKEEEEKDGNQRNDDEGKGQSSQGPRKTKNFKKNSVSSSSSSGGLSSMFRGEVVDFLEAVDFRGKGILVVQVLLYAADVIIGILRSVGEAAVDAILVNRWDIGLHIALKISRGPNSLPYHRLRQPNKFQDLVVMPKLVMELLIIIRATSLLILQGIISIHRTLIIRVV
ncbi:hypothetical protein ACFXTH_015016 [Malus domestica]